MATKSKSKTRSGGARAKAKPSTRATSRAKVVVEREHGPVKWIMPTMESAYARLGATSPVVEGGAASMSSARKPPAAKGFKVLIQRGAGQEFYAPVHATVWLDRLIEYKKRKAASHGRAAAALGGAAGFGPAGPTIPGAKKLK